MNIFKEAQAISFANPAMLQNFLGKIKNDAEFSEYISLLSAIHGELSQGLPIEQALDNTIGAGYGRGQAKKLIDAIGQETFASTDFFLISESLSELRISVIPAKAEEMVATTPVETSGPEQSIEFPTVLPREDLDLMSAQAVHKYFQTLHFSPSRKEAATQMIDEFGRLFTDLRAGKYRGTEIRDVNRRLSDLKTRITILAEETLDDLEDERVGQIPDADSVKIEAPEPIRIKKTPQIAEEDAETEETEFEDAIDVAEVDESAVVDKDLRNHALFKDIIMTDGRLIPIDLSVVPPVVDWAVIDRVYDGFKKELDSLATYAANNMNNMSRPERAKKFALNSLMFAIKEFSVQLLNEITDAAKIQEDSNIRQQFEEVKLEVSENLPVRRILLDESLSEKLYMAALFLESPSLARVVIGGNPELLLRVARGKNQESIVEKQGDRDRFREKMATLSRSYTRTKIKEFLSINYNTTNVNFLKHISLSVGNIFSRSRRALNNEDGSEVINKYRPCPTCFKWINWEYKREYMEKNPKLKSFKVRLFSLFRPDGEPITLEQLTVDGRGVRKFAPPKPALFTDPDVRAFVSRLHRSKTWEQINELLLSNKPDEHQEGWHRRAGALNELHATPKGETYVRSIMSECPFDENYSGCGIGLSNYEGMNTLGLAGLQPVWNGSINWDIGLPSRIIPDTKVLSKEQINKARKLQSGGYKFSKVNFACPCHIPSTTSDTNYKHSTLVIPKTGPTGYSSYATYPTRPDGSIDSDFVNAKGTMGFLVCAAPTSLSSFDRSPESDGYILKYLKEIKSSSRDQYQDLLDFLLKDGVDFGTLLELNSHVDVFSTENKEASYDFKNRKKELSSLLTKIAAIKLPEGTAYRELYNKLSLICPFGHRFTIQQSLDFGAKHVALQDQRITLYDYIINTRGDENIRNMISGRQRTPGQEGVGGFLVPRSSYPNHTGLIYEEWIKADPRTEFPLIDKPEIPVLMFKILDINDSVNEFFISTKIAKKMRKEAWPGDETYLSKQTKEDYIPQEGGFGSEVSLTVTDEAGEEFNRSDIQQGKQFTGGLKDEDVGTGTFILASAAIPGTIPTDNTLIGDRKELDSKIKSLSRTLKAALTIIMTWTNKLASAAMARSLMTPYTVKLDKHQLYFEKLITNIVTVFDKQGDRLTYGDVRTNLISGAASHLVLILERKIENLHEWIRDNLEKLTDHAEDADKQIAVKIMAISISEMIDRFSSDLGEVELLADDAEAFITSRILALSGEKSFRDLVAEITLNSAEYKKKTEERLSYTSQVILVSYARHLADVIVRLNDTYFKDSSSVYYLGFPIGLDLSDTEKIIGYEKDGQWVEGLTKEDLDKLITGIADVKEKINFNTHPSPAQKIDKAYEDLAKSLQMARYFSITPKMMGSAKKYLVSRLSFVAGARSTELREKLSNVFPTKTLTFSGTPENPETSVLSLPRFRRPFIDKGVDIADFPGSKMVSEWCVVDHAAKYNKQLINRKLFSKKEDVESYIREAEAAEPGLKEKYKLRGERFTVEDLHYFINDDLGYNGSVHQVGMIGDKPGETLAWPPPIEGYASKKGGFVGLMLPFSISDSSASSISSLRDLAITDYQVVVELDGKSVDISFLFQRGRDETQAAIIIERERQILNRLEIAEEAIRVFKVEHEKAIVMDDSILANYRKKIMDQANMEVFKIRNDIAKMPLRIRPSSTYGEVHEGEFVGLPMPAIMLEDPMRCHKIITNPELRGVNLTKEQKSELINFIIQIYNINEIRDIIRYLGNDDSITSYDILTYKSIKDIPFKVIKGPYKNIDSMLKKDEWIDDRDPQNPVRKVGWKKSPGMYFKAIPGDAESDAGTYLEYAYHPFPAQKDLADNEHPKASSLHNYIGLMRKMGLTSVSDVEHVDRATDAMVKYIEREAAGPQVEDPKKKKKSSQTYSHNILLRQKELERIIKGSEERWHPEDFLIK